MRCSKSSPEGQMPRGLTRVGISTSYSHRRPEQDSGHQRRGQQGKGKWPAGARLQLDPRSEFSCPIKPPMTVVNNNTYFKRATREELDTRNDKCLR